MLILGIDTACACAKAALTENGRVLGEAYANDQKTHSVKLMPMIDGLFQKAGRSVDQVELIGAVTGPGSFTGLRIGAATAKAIAYSLRIPVVGINTLDFLAASVSDSRDAVVCPAIDARNQNVYCNAYIDGEPVWDCRVCHADDLTARLRALSKETGRRILVTGDGAPLYLNTFPLAPETELLGTASVLCRLAERGRDRATDCFALEVKYYRQTQAERMRHGQL